MQKSKKLAAFKVGACRSQKHAGFEIKQFYKNKYTIKLTFANQLIFIH